MKIKKPNDNKQKIKNRILEIIYCAVECLVVYVLLFTHSNKSFINETDIVMTFLVSTISLTFFVPYDEMQQQKRNKIFSAMFFVLIMYFFTWLLIDVAFSTDFFSSKHVIYYGIMGVISLCMVLLIFNDCFIKRTTQSSLAGLYALFGIVACSCVMFSLLTLAISTITGSFIDNIFSSLLLPFSTIISLSFFIKELLNHKKTKAETEE